MTWAMLASAMPACSEAPRVGPRVESADPCAGVAASSFEVIWASYFSSCATCHVDGPGGFAFDTPFEMWQRSVGQPSIGNPGMPRVTPGDPLNSYLYLKLLPDAAGRMPLNGPYLDEGEREAVLGWICSGALQSDNPAPSIAAISPDAVVGSDGAFSLTVYGASFVPTSTVQIGASALATHYVSETELTADVLASHVGEPGEYAITVSSPAPGGGTSGGLTLTVLPDNPVPSISAISPLTVVAGAGDVQLTVDGEGFVPGSELEIDGIRLATTYQSSSQLVAVVDANVIGVGSHTITAWNPPPGGGTSGGTTLTVENPVPSISSIWPDTVAAGSGPFTLSVVGAGFLPDSAVEIDGMTRNTVYSSSSQLTADVPASDIADLGTRTVTVSNPAPGGGTSGGATLTVAASQPDNPVPSISSIAPTAIGAGTAQPVLTVTGAGFIPGSEVAIDGAPRVTHYASDTQLTADLLGADVATVGTHAITVSNPLPGGGTSADVTLSVEYPAPSISAISPSTVGVDPGPITVTVDGAGFFPVSTVSIEGLDRATQYVSSSVLTAELIAGDVAAAGERAVTVSNPLPGGGTSAAVTLTVTDQASIASLLPCGIVQGASTFPLTITGLNFADGVTATFDGSPVTVVRDSATQLTASIPASLVAAAPASRAVPVVVTNPSAQPSNTVHFGVAGRLSTLSLHVQPIFTSKCGTSCHRGGGSVGLDLRDGYSYASLVGVPSTKCSGNPRVLPCGPLRTQSVLVDAILATDATKVCSQVNQMPKAGDLLPAERDLIIDWVAQGAPR